MNIAQIAELAGVSKAAVSRYFNNGYISREKREAIQRVVEETGYRPSLQAQTLRTKKTKLIGVIVPKIASASIGKIVEGILSVINEKGYQMLLAVTQNDPEKELEYLTAFDEKQVDGVILAATVFGTAHKQILKKLSVPVVIVGQQLSGYNCVYHDDYHASYDLTKRMIETGRSSLGYIGATQQDKAVGEERYRGFCDGMRHMGYGDQAGRMAIASFTVASGYEKAKELLERYEDLNGIICATDSIAAGAAQYLHEHGGTLSSQVIVAGQGDSDMSRVTNPPFMTVHYFYEKSGETAVRILMEILEEKKEALEEVKLGYYIVEP